MDLFLSGAEVRVFPTGLLGCLLDVEFIGGIRLSSLNKLGEEELQCGAGQLRPSEWGLL